MEENRLSITKVDITINVVKVGNHKMTKATFRQIPKIKLTPCRDGPPPQWFTPFPTEDKILGWVYENQYWLLFSLGGKIMKANDLEQWTIGGTPATEKLTQVYIAT